MQHMGMLDNTCYASHRTAATPHCRKTLWEAEGKDSSVEDATVNFSCNVLFLDARISRANITSSTFMIGHTGDSGELGTGKTAEPHIC